MFYYCRFLNLNQSSYMFTINIWTFIVNKKNLIKNEYYILTTLVITHSLAVNCIPKFISLLLCLLHFVCFIRFTTWIIFLCVYNKLLNIIIRKFNNDNYFEFSIPKEYYILSTTHALLLSPAYWLHVRVLNLTPKSRFCRWYFFFFENWFCRWYLASCACACLHSLLTE
jgi:hypothetical protein